MLRFLADENFPRAIYRALRQHDVDIVRVQDVGLTGHSDPAVLAWAAEQQRILLTSDVQTLVRDAWERVRAGEPMPGVIEVRAGLPTRQVIDDLLLIARDSDASDWQDMINYLPL